MVIGTLTSGAEQEYLMIAKTRLPINEKLASDVKDFNNKDAVAAFSKAENKIEIEKRRVSKFAYSFFGLSRNFQIWKILIVSQRNTK